MVTELICGNCMDIMPKLQSQSINLVLTDLPYGVTQNPADVPLPLDVLWVQWKRLLKPQGTVILTSQFPYTIDLILSNRTWFKYDLVWNKVLVSGYLNANKMPLRVHEHILVFYEKTPRYFPHKTIGQKSHSRGTKLQVARRNYGEHEEVDNSEKHGCFKHPTSIISIPKPHSSVALHPTEKPIALAEYLIKNYTVKDDSVLDCCVGTGWTVIASKKLGRNAIGIDINSEYIDIAKKRLARIPEQISSFLKISPEVNQTTRQVNRTRSNHKF